MMIWRERLASAALHLALAAMLVGVTPLAAQRGADRLAGLDGGALTAAQLASGDSVLIFWTSWSPRCRDIVAKADAIHAAWDGKARVALVNWQEDAPAVRAFLGGAGSAAAVFLDTSGAFAKKYDIVDLPGMVIFKAGKVAYQGKLPRDPDALIARVLG